MQLLATPELSGATLFDYSLAVFRGAVCHDASTEGAFLFTWRTAVLHFAFSTGLVAACCLSGFPESLLTLFIELIVCFFSGRFVA